jgi:DNA-binding response OmpR family regulator
MKLEMTETEKFMFNKLNENLGEPVSFCDMVPNCTFKLSEDRKNSLKVAISNFKKKLPPEYIVTSIRNVGYIMLKK